MVLINSTSLETQEYARVNFTQIEWESLKTDSLDIKDPSHIVCGLVCSNRDDCSGVLFNEETGFCEVATVGNRI